jgi:RimJ/RimL family protein N-acetyltransferase
LRAVADWTLVTMTVIRLVVFIVVGNVASEHMVARAGFRREGVLRS